MQRLFVIGLIIFGIYYMGVGGAGIFKDIQNGNAAQVIRGFTQDELNTRILNHYKEAVLGGVSEFTPDAIDTTITDLNDDGKKDVIAVTESPLTCGGGGCIASIFLENEFGELVALPFSYAVKNIEVLASLTNGMHDLEVNSEQSQRMVWNGSTYVLE
jgi:hypothetical protein